MTKRKERHEGEELRKRKSENGVGGKGKKEPRTRKNHLKREPRTGKEGRNREEDKENIEEKEEEEVKGKVQLPSRWRKMAAGYYVGVALWLREGGRGKGEGK